MRRAPQWSIMEHRRSSLSSFIIHFTVQPGNRNQGNGRTCAILSLLSEPVGREHTWCSISFLLPESFWANQKVKGQESPHSCSHTLPTLDNEPVMKSVSVCNAHRKTHMKIMKDKWTYYPMLCSRFKEKKKKQRKSGSFLAERRQ